MSTHFKCCTPKTFFCFYCRKFVFHNFAKNLTKIKISIPKSSTIKLTFLWNVHQSSPLTDIFCLQCPSKADICLAKLFYAHFAQPGISSYYRWCKARCASVQPFKEAIPVRRGDAAIIIIIIWISVYCWACNIDRDDKEMLLNDTTIRTQLKLSHAPLKLEPAPAFIGPAHLWRIF